ncbi:MAG: type I restriction enzyme HsdR N-terminal domain-containing protein [Desulfurivibrionaceae bacterium]
MEDTSQHHYIYGYCTDYVTGESVQDTDDERYRQKIARFLVEEKGYEKTDLELRQVIETTFAGHLVRSKIDIVVKHQGRRVMLIRYGPGSLVTRERPAVAAARVFDDSYQIPLAVVTNGEDSELLDTRSGRVLATGLAGMPDKSYIEENFADLDFSPPPEEKKREKELRILNAFDREVCCRDESCRIPEEGENS